MAALALLEIFDRRDIRHWVALATLAGVMILLGTFWIAVRQGYRDRILHDEAFAQSTSKRLNEIKSLTAGWSTRDAESLSSAADQFVDRVWAVYYPALAVARVPNVVPHANGQLLWRTLQHVATPRIFFPDKAVLGSESELVRMYSGVWVAGEKEQTNIAFGYAAESYVDFGIPLMFAPVWLYGVLIGLVYASLLRVIRHRDLAISVVTVFGWMSLYLFERSWTKTIGLAGTLMIYVGGLTICLDQLWIQNFTLLDASDDMPLESGDEPAFDLEP